VQKNSEVKQTIKITNQRDKPVILESADVDSESFTVQLREIEKGKRYEVEVATVPPLRQGSTRAQVTIMTDAKDQPVLRLPIYAYVRPRVLLAPRTIWVPQSAPRDVHRVLTLRNLGTTPVNVTKVEVSDPAIQATIEPVAKGKTSRIRLMLPAGTGIPKNGLTITISTDDAEYPKLTATLRPYPMRGLRRRGKHGPTTRPAPIPTPRGSHRTRPK